MKPVWIPKYAVPGPRGHTGIAESPGMVRWTDPTG